MNSFSMRSAWSLGCRFVAQRALGHAVILIGIGILAPFLLQYAIAGGPAETSGPTPLLISQSGPGAGLGTPSIIALALGYVLQTASYFASWRLGFGGDRPLAGALLYGLVAGLLAVAVIAGVGILATMVARWAGFSGTPFLAMLTVLIPLIMVFALFYTMLAALFAAAVSLMLVLAMVFGMATGQLGLAATLVGGSGGIAVLFLVLSGVLMWLAARLSCATSVMADRKSFNPIAAIRESWRLTWDEQWAILRYLALIGFALAVVILGVAVAAGASATALLQREAQPALQAGAIVLRLAAAIPLAFLTVLVPAGIYRELTRSTASAEVFA